MKRKRIKWGNIALILVLIASSLFILNDFRILATNLATLTPFGVITGILATLIASYCMEELVSEMA